MIKYSYSGYRFPPEIIQHAIWLYISVHAELPRRQQQRDLTEIVDWLRDDEMKQAMKRTMRDALRRTWEKSRKS
jgi:hypothetical protein